MNLEAELQKYGVASRSVRSLDAPPSPELLDYLDLVERREQRPQLWPHCVVENQGRPLLFIVNEISLALPPSETPSEFDNLRHLLACRGERSYLARVLPGELKVVPVGFGPLPGWKTYHPGTGEATTFVSRLALGEYDGAGEPRDSDFVFSEMFELLTGVANRLVGVVSKLDVLSLIGRALFFRFLRDRHVITDRDTRAVAPKAIELLACFDNAANAEATCQWLDRTFNGDFLPLSDGGSRLFFERVEAETNGRVFSELRAILRREKPVGKQSYQLQFDWSDFDFAHVPVGLLSQVYEAFCWKWDPHLSKETSVHYTPRSIAATLVGEVFDRLPEAHKARVLDPACGAGIFLVLAFRRLYREHWNAVGKRPDTTDIRQILERQLVGFDTSDFALRLAALSLYLTAIELDPNPIPPEKLSFRVPLRGRVLFNFGHRDNDHAAGFEIGSLGPDVDTSFDGSFQIVLSNPPWTSLPPEKKELAKQLEEATRSVIRRKGEADIADGYHNPDNSPDLPFIWRATEWCTPDGRIAMALPARILLKQEETPRFAREMLFRLVEVTGIINGSNLSDTRVWPGMSQPFMLLFARNGRPRENAVLRLITPYYDAHLNRRGEVRVDSESSQPLEVEMTLDDPWLWKTLAIGSSLDVDVVRKIMRSSEVSLKAYWDQLKLASNQGYRIAEKQKQYPAQFLKGLPNLASTDRFQFIVRPEELASLDRFDRDTLNRPREEAIYEPPLLLVKASPGNNRKSSRALLCLDKIAYIESFFGYSASRHPQGEFIVRYIHLFAHSRLWLYYALMTSAEFGAERRKLHKADVDERRFLPPEQLTAEQRQKVLLLSERLVSKDLTVFDDIDTFVCGLYGLGKLDVEVIRDTLDVGLPYKSARQRACGRANRVERDGFCRRVEILLRPFFEVMGNEPRVRVWEPSDHYEASHSPFAVILVSRADRAAPAPDEVFHTAILPLANETGATRIIQERDGGLVIGILNQYRYWTQSRARLRAGEVLSNHAGVFEA